MPAPLDRSTKDQIAKLKRFARVFESLKDQPGDIRASAADVLLGHIDRHPEALAIACDVTPDKVAPAFQRLRKEIAAEWSESCDMPRGAWMSFRLAGAVVGQLGKAAARQREAQTAAAQATADQLTWREGDWPGLLAIAAKARAAKATVLQLGNADTGLCVPVGQLLAASKSFPADTVVSMGGDWPQLRLSCRDGKCNVRLRCAPTPDRFTVAVLPWKAPAVASAPAPAPALPPGIPAGAVPISALAVVAAPAAAPATVVAPAPKPQRARKAGGAKGKPAAAPAPALPADVAHGAPKAVYTVGAEAFSAEDLGTVANACGATVVIDCRRRGTRARARARDIGHLPGLRVDAPDYMPDLIRHLATQCVGETVLLVWWHDAPGDCDRHHVFAPALRRAIGLDVTHVYRDPEIDAAELEFVTAPELQRAIDDDNDYSCETLRALAIPAVAS